MTVGQRLKIAREKAGLTQEELAHLVGYKSRTNIAKIEGGRDIPRRMLEKFAQVLNVSPAFLFGVEDEIKPYYAETQLVNNDPELTEYLEELKNRPELRMMFSLTKNATKADVERAVAIVEAFLKTKENNNE